MVALNISCPCAALGERFSDMGDNAMLIAQPNQQDGSIQLDVENNKFMMNGGSVVSNRGESPGFEDCVCPYICRPARWAGPSLPTCSAPGRRQPNRAVSAVTDAPPPFSRPPAGAHGSLRPGWWAGTVPVPVRRRRRVTPRSLRPDGELLPRLGVRAQHSAVGFGIPMPGAAFQGRCAPTAPRPYPSRGSDRRRGPPLGHGDAVEVRARLGSGVPLRRISESRLHRGRGSRPTRRWASGPQSPRDGLGSDAASRDTRSGRAPTRSLAGRGGERAEHHPSHPDAPRHGTARASRRAGSEACGGGDACGGGVDVRACVLSCVRACARARVRGCVGAWVRGCVRAFVRACVRGRLARTQPRACEPAASPPPPAVTW
jgi:hypothetical protein